MTPKTNFETLPWFVYHPDPVASGSVVRSEKACRACGQAHGYIYVGPVYGREDVDESLCPWCIADGTAHAQLNVTFADVELVGGHGWEEVPRAVAEHVACRTPGFAGWQQERWFAHCGDAAAFIAPMGRAEIENAGTQAIAAIREESSLEGADWESYFQSLDKDRGPTAYLFRCRHCGTFGGYSDTH